MSLAPTLEDAKQTATLRRHARLVSNQLSDYGVFLPTPIDLAAMQGGKRPGASQKLLS
jgi:hypothetical protein